MRAGSLAACIGALCVAIPVDAGEEHCPATPLDVFIRDGRDLYLGEGHGTVESPALVRCLVTVALERRKEPLIVSLEQPPSARDLESDAWRGVDGRNSEAMWSLIRFLIEQERAGRLELHLQLSFPIAFVPDAAPPMPDFAVYERNMGTPLRELAARGQLIALSGNAHSRKDPLPGLRPSYDPAGSYVGPDVLHVDLEPAAGGTAWNCLAGGCGIHEVLRGSPFEGPRDTLMDGKPFGHDFVYRLPRVTASPPRIVGPGKMP